MSLAFSIDPCLQGTRGGDWGEPERAPYWLENRVYERHIYSGYEQKNAMTIVCTSVT